MATYPEAPDASPLAEHRSSMVRVEGTVTAQLPSGLYSIEAGGSQITAHVAGGAARNFVRVLVGDRVLIELTGQDATRGRIVRRLPH